MSNPVPYADQPCERCSSKKRIINIKKVKTLIFDHSTEIEHSQIICTNKECQAEFERKLKEKREKDEALKQKRAAHKASLTLQGQASKNSIA